jgi:hypothetical protein
MQLYTPADVTGDGAAHTLASIPGAPQLCKWFQVTGINIGAQSLRIGDAGVSATRGTPVGPGGAQFSPPVSFVAMEFYDLNAIYFLLATGDTMSLTCAA